MEKDEAEATAPLDEVTASDGADLESRVIYLRAWAAQAELARSANEPRRAHSLLIVV